MFNKKAFTLVELIVVITILTILSTIGFVSFSGYLAGTRDTNRVSQLKSMSNALELYRTKKSLPIPDDKIDIQYSGSVIAYQGYIGKNVLETIEYTESGLDPKDKQYFSYYLTKNKKYFQLLAFLEEPNTDVVALNSFNKTFATDYSDRYPKTTGKKLGILTDSNNTFIQNVDIITGSGYLDISDVGNLELKSYLKDNEYVTGTGTKFQRLLDVDSLGGKFWTVENNDYVYMKYVCKYMSAEQVNNLNTAFDFLSSTPMTKDEWCNSDSIFYSYSPEQDIMPIFPKEIGYLNNLISIDINVNSNILLFNKIPDEIKYLKKLEILNLNTDYNGNLEEISKEILELTKLKSLILSHFDQITSIPKEIGNLTNLTELDLRSNNISELPSEITKLNKLEYLSLRSNDNLGNLSDTFDSNDTSKVCDTVGTNGDNICIQYVTDHLNITIEN